MKSEEYQQRQIDLINSNDINISSGNDLKDFIIVFCKFVVLVLAFIYTLNYLSFSLIDNLSIKTQRKIESFLKISAPELQKFDEEEKYSEKIILLNRIKNEILSRDKNIPNSVNLPLKIYNNRRFNAMIYPNGNIYFSKGALKENFTEQELAYVLAHEIGHYSNKDHLKGLSKKITMFILCIILGHNDAVDSIAANIAHLEFMNYSRNQEEKADTYAGKMLINIYGTTEGGISFMKKMQKKEKLPEILRYFSTHPSWNKRIKILENNA